MAAAHGDFCDAVCEGEQTASTHPQEFVYQEPCAPQMADAACTNNCFSPFGYRTETLFRGETYYVPPPPQPAASHDGACYDGACNEVPHPHHAMSVYHHPGHFHLQSHYLEAPLYLPYAHHSLPVYHDQQVTYAVYPHAERQNFAPAQAPYHAKYQPQCTPFGAPQFQGHFSVDGMPVHGFHQQHPAPIPEMQSSPVPSVEDLNVCEDLRVSKRDKGHKSRTNQRPGPHNCAFPDCGRVYTKGALLKAHMRTHREEIYHCNWGGCGLKFSGSDELARHVRKHTGEHRGLRSQLRKVSHFNHLEVNLKTHK